MRILKLSERFNERPSEILGIEDNYLAFCFDEACDFILSMRETIKTVGKDGLIHESSKWRKTPHFTDEVKPLNNSDLINEMQSVLDNKRYR